jgi:hypothetical protein
MQKMAHGPNIGNGFVKYIVIDANGEELPPVVFPALIAPAQLAVAGALGQVEPVVVNGHAWWVGEGALLDETPRSLLGQERLHDGSFVPALLARALRELDAYGGAQEGICVTGLPATWAQDASKAKLLGERLRAAVPPYTRIRVIPEPLGMIYAVTLDTDGQIVGDDALLRGHVAVVDGGHGTVDLALVKQLTPLANGLRTWQLGTSRPLGQIQAHLGAAFDREFSLHEVDAAVRQSSVVVAGRRRPLPDHWDRPLIENGQAIASRLTEALGSGAQFDGILLGGGFALEPRLTAPILAQFAHAQIVDQPQLAIARGYARLARRLGQEGG